jgi:DNA-binding MarR family transcriptional regulator
MTITAVSGLSNFQLQGHNKVMTDTQVRWLTSQEQRAWRLFLTATQILFSAVDGQLQRDSCIPHGYYEILVRLSEAEDRSLRMSQLAEASTSSKSRLSHAVARLEERGWVERLDCKTDRRGQIARLTDAGYAALEAAAPGHADQVRRSLFDRLSGDQVEQLAAISTAIAAGEQPAPCDRGELDEPACPLPCDSELEE